MLDIFLVIVPLFLIIFGSALVGKVKKLDESWEKVLNSFALNVGLPALIFASLSKISLQGHGGIIVANSLFLLFSFAIVYGVGRALKLKDKILKTLFICLSFGNIAYIGPPVLTQIYGQKILPEVSLIIGIHLFWIFTIGIGYLDYRTTIKQSWVGKLFNKKAKEEIIKHIGMDLIKNPLLISIALGLLVSMANFRLPRMISTSVDILAASVSPVVLVVIGLFMARASLGKLKEWMPVAIFSLVTLFAIPGAFYLGIKVFASGDLHVYLPSLLEFAMPLAITPFALADQFGLDKKFIARSIVLSTSLSILTLPIWATMI